MKQNVRWGGLSVFHEYSPPPPLDEPWSINVERNFYRLLQAPSWSLARVNEIDPSQFDAFLMPEWNIAWIDAEVALAKRLSEGGCKVVTAYSHDLRFLIGNAMINEETGTLWTATCEYASLILSGLPEHLHMFGRYEDKVMSFGYPFERMQLGDVPLEDRAIDMLVSSSSGMENLGYVLELLLFIKEKNPDRRIVFSIDPAHAPKYERYADRIEFVPGGLLNYLPHTKVYLNPELRPRAGRAMHEAWICRTPFISASTTYYSKLFPFAAYDKMDMKEINDKYQRLLSELDEQMTLANQVAEGEYWDVTYHKLIERLFPGE